MNQYSIRDLEKLSGIKAHTLRMWEQRYGVLEPKRTDTNIRYYSDDDLKRILNISLLNSNNVKISKIAKMSEEEISTAVIKLTEQTSILDNQVSALSISMIEMDEDHFEKVLSGNILRHGFEKTMVNVIFPFLEKVGLMWMTGSINPAQEHFISNMIRQKLIVAIDGQVTTNVRNDVSYMLFCPEKEFHELGLLFMNYLLRTRKCRSIYLGSSVPFSDLRTVFDIHQPRFLFTYITTNPTGKDLEGYLKKIADEFPNTTLLVAGRQVDLSSISLPKNALYLPEVKDALEQIEHAKRSGEEFFSRN